MTAFSQGKVHHGARVSGKPSQGELDALSGKMAIRSRFPAAARTSSGPNGIWRLDPREISKGTFDMKPFVREREAA